MFQEEISGKTFVTYSFPALKSPYRLLYYGILNEDLVSKNFWLSSDSAKETILYNLGCQNRHVDLVMAKAYSFVFLADFDEPPEKIQ